ncbi:MAG: protoporphyrinogen oxidase [Chloroflexi bacterium]|nr:protoporphyrinogen oxidase [Chloroflexota bacterium]
MKLTIIGGGITGLSAAYHAIKQAKEENIPLELTLLEADSHWGGKIKTDRTDGFVIEGGPDTFLATKPWGMALCKELGLSDRLHGTNPEQKNTYVLHKDELVGLPDGLAMMIPGKVMPMLITPLLNPLQKMRIGLDFLLPTRKGDEDESLGSFISRRMGRATYENLIEPLMSGIYAGDGDKLSLQSTFPFLRDFEIKYGSLARGAMKMYRARVKSQKQTGSRSVFRTPTTGLAEITEALVAYLEENNANLHLNTPVSLVTPHSSHYEIGLDNGKTLKSDTLILASPPYVTGDLIESHLPELAEVLKSIPYVSTATVSLAYKLGDLPRALDGYGYVIPRREGRKALACTWTSTKFPHRAPEGHALLRVFVGRAGQENDIPWNEEGLLEIAREELALTLGITADPLLSRTYIWEKAMPQYNLGHPEKIDAINAALADIPTLAFAGNGYHGIGIPNCINSGDMAAQKILAKGK